MERRLAAILAADVVGYSRLTEADEEATVRALDACRRLIDRLVADHHGRVFGSSGDSLISEFASPVEAVRCAVEIQAALAERNAALPAHRRMPFRIGINLGDIVVDTDDLRGDDLLGDGVNVAARLEGLAEPGGIVLSESAYAQVRKTLDLGFEFLGRHTVKNIAEPVAAYRVHAEATAVPRWSQAARRQWQRGAVGAVLLVTLALAAATAWNFYRQFHGPRVEPASLARMAFPLPDKPSIAVLPFANMSGEREQDYFADGMTDDLITDLSKVAGLFVIARNTTFAYKGQAVKVRQVAEELGVRYVLEGSVRRAGDKVRINAQLIDAVSGGHIWAERYDGALADVFALQDKVLREIVGALALNLSEGEELVVARSETRNIDAREAFQVGWEHYLRFTPQENAKAVPLLLEAVERDPDYGQAHAALALVYTRGCAWRWHEPLGLTTTEAYGKALSNLRVAERRESPLAQVAGAKLHFYAGLHDEGTAAAQRAVALAPNDPEAHLVMAWSMITSGRPADAIFSLETAMRLNPHHAGHYPLALGIAHYALGDYETAGGILEKGLDRNPEARELLPALAAVQVRLGQRVAARASLERWKADIHELAAQGFLVDYKLPYEWSPEQIRTKESILGAVELAVLPLDVTLETLTASLRESELAFVRAGAARKIGLFAEAAAAAVPALIAALSDEHRLVRNKVATALGQIGPAASAAIPALEAVRDDPVMRTAADDALARIKGE